METAVLLEHSATMKALGGFIVTGLQSCVRVETVKVWGSREKDKVTFQEI